MTKYAQQILDLVLCSTEHPTAEQIFLQMKQEHSKIAAHPTATTTPRATIT